MTTEVLILNKRAVVAAADSAVTSSRGDGTQPRYSKTANKIFELSDRGGVAVAIFGSASLDCVPWELGLKLFRKHLGGEQVTTVQDCAQRLMAFLTANEILFPTALREGFVEQQFDSAALTLVKLFRTAHPTLFDVSAALPDRQATWDTVYAETHSTLSALPIASGLTAAAQDAALAGIGSVWAGRLQVDLQAAPELVAIDAGQLAELIHMYRYRLTERLLPTYTGVAVFGYGETEIFPSYCLCHVVGHVGHELHWELKKAESISHAKSALLLPLAQKSMIDLFTDGFGLSLWTIIGEANRAALEQLATELQPASGLPEQTQVRLQTIHDEFMARWTRKNWEENYHPLMDVLEQLSVEEMAHLAETLLVLQSLKERVTSSSETVGGPIDVASITKAEGLVWLKRKHYFGAELNQRYVARLNRNLGNA